MTHPTMTFQGWTTDPILNNPEYADGATLPSHLGNDGDNITLYAVWQ